MSNYYKILKSPYDATIEEIKQQYKSTAENFIECPQNTYFKSYSISRISTKDENGDWITHEKIQSNINGKKETKENTYKMNRPVKIKYRLTNE
jgi:hypothetical protein